MKKQIMKLSHLVFQLSTWLKSRFKQCDYKSHKLESKCQNIGESNFWCGVKYTYIQEKLENSREKMIDMNKKVKST